MSVVRRTETRRTETPNGVMTTFASPTQGGTGLSMWHVEMAPGRQGPPHAADAEQIWTFLTGGATVDLAGDVLTVGPGDTLVLPAGLARRVATDTGFTAVAVAPAPCRVYNPDRVTPEHACELAPKAAERIVPPWMA
ncbi:MULTISPECIES: cupin domain-containing protein [unclassified Kitasatospora]|uniref:cupin domain-containing protein n=1 Tax=unclassified Kitasatospora TaxID=2633591 RepID=UPI0038210822